MTGTRRVRGSAEVIRSLFYLGDGFLKTSATLALAPARNRMLEGIIPPERERSTSGHMEGPYTGEIADAGHRTIPQSVAWRSDKACRWPSPIWAVKNSSKRWAAFGVGVNGVT